MEISTLSSVSSSISATYSKTTNKDGSTTETLELKSSESSTNAAKFSSEAAVYEKSSDSDTIASKNNSTDRSALISQLQQDAENLKNSLLDIVRKTISGQNNAFAIASDDESIWHLLASGDFTADADTIAKAKEDISEDGYWGVEQTSSRIVDFAITLSGNDTSKAETLIEAFKKGFSQATGIWGQDLPDISNKTYDAVMEKFEAWQNGEYPPADEE